MVVVLGPVGWGSSLPVAARLPTVRTLRKTPIQTIVKSCLLIGFLPLMVCWLMVPNFPFAATATMTTAKDTPARRSPSLLQDSAPRGEFNRVPGCAQGYRRQEAGAVGRADRTVFSSFFSESLGGQHG